MKTLKINLYNKFYEVIIENNIFNNIGNEIRKLNKYHNAAVITDDNIYSLYGENLKNQLLKNNFIPNFIIIPHGENSKTLEMLKNIYSNLTNYYITRSDLIISLGGGVVGDLAGFAASTYLRGIDYIQIPTTLLAQIDSSIGGKVAVNLDEGKNLAGSFYHPVKVIIDPLVLNTLPTQYISDGMAEVIKYACIRDSTLYEKLSRINNLDELYKEFEDIIYTCCSIKKELVEKDEKDKNIRMILNFGHTLGHAIEKYYNYEKYTHGEAVAVGMYYITRKSESLGYTKGDTSEKIKKLLLKYNLDFELPNINMEKIKQIIKLDKKNISGSLNIVLLKEIGCAYIKKLTAEDLNSFFKYYNWRIDEKFID